jgi:hypothetical protein
MGLDIPAPATEAAPVAVEPAPAAPTVETAAATPAGEAPLAPPPPVFSAPAAPPAPPPKALRPTSGASPFADVKPSGGTWAVMIGVNDYPGSDHDLKSAVNDARDVDEALAQVDVPGDHRLFLRDTQASAQAIALAADWLVAHASKDATAVFFYAGHVRKLSSTTEAVVGADGETLTDADLASHLAKLQAKQAWVAMAACYGGGFQELLAPGRVLTAAAGPDDIAYENERFGRSYLVQYMVRQGMIQGQSGLSVQAAFAYAHDAISRDFPGREPVQFDRSSGAFDLRPPPPPAPAPEQPTPAPPPPTTPPTTEPPHECASMNIQVLTCQ